MILLRHFCIIFLVLFQHLLGYDARIVPLQILQYNTKIWSKIAEVIFWTLLKYRLNQPYAHDVWNEPSKDKNEAKRPPKGVKTGHFEEKCMFFEKKLGKDLVEWKNRRTFATANEKEQRFTLKTRMPWAISAAGSEHLPYKQRVGGSNPSSPTKLMNKEMAP